MFTLNRSCLENPSPVDSCCRGSALGLPMKINSEFPTANACSHSTSPAGLWGVSPPPSPGALHLGRRLMSAWVLPDTGREARKSSHTACSISPDYSRAKVEANLCCKITSWCTHNLVAMIWNSAFDIIQAYLSLFHAYGWI